MFSNTLSSCALIDKLTVARVSAMPVRCFRSTQPERLTVFAVSPLCPVECETRGIISYRDQHTLDISIRLTFESSERFVIRGFLIFQSNEANVPAALIVIVRFYVK
jgi:hypothetical protein